MRILVRLTSSSRHVFLPYSYPEFVQALIYKFLPENRAGQLHEEGFPYEKRRFKLFTYSRLQGKLERREPKKGLYFFPPVEFKVGSPVDWILQGLAEGLLKEGVIQLGQSEMQVDSIAVETPKNFSDSVKIKMLSPVTVYSTFHKPDGKKLTHYYTPFDAEFSELITRNLQKKYEVLYKKKCEETLRITPLFRHNRERILTYKKTIIKAWDGSYQLEGNPELIHISYQTGLGSKNSQGFGMWGAVDH